MSDCIRKVIPLQRNLGIMSSNRKRQMEKSSPAKIFKNSGYLGGFKGDKDLSVNYKEILANSIKKKYDKNYI